MRFIKLFLGLLLLFGSNHFAFSQAVSNVNVIPKGNSIEVTYDLGGEGLFDVKLYFSDDNAKTWKGPLKLVTGDVGAMQKKGVAKKIIWDAAGEQNEFEGVLQFKIVADLMDAQALPKISDAMSLKLKKINQQRTLWAVSTLITAGVGAYSLTQTTKLYEDYKNATNDAASIRSKIEGLNLIGPIALGLAGFSAVEFILQSAKYKKTKKAALSAVYVPKGAGLSFSLNF